MQGDDPQVGHVGVVPLVKEDVAGLDVPVDHPFGVRLVQGRGDTLDNACDLGQGKRASANAIF